MVRIPLLMVAVWALMALSLGGALPGPALAATITVNTFADELNADGDCSLREAVVAANTNAAVDSCTAGSGADTINLQTGNYALMLAGSEDAAANGDLDLIGTVTIAGVNTTVKTIPATTDRVFHVLAGATADISGVNVEGGQGGAGGGILILGTLTLSNSTVRLNAGGNGAGVYNAGTLTVNSSTIENNIGSLNGAGIYNNGTATVDGSTVSGNTASTDGGGIYSAGGSVTLTDSTVSGNDASQAGGGVNIQAGTFTLNNSTVSGNDGTLGGGIYKFGTVAVPVPVTLNGSTVSGNGASSTQGGGIYSAGDW